MSIYVSKSLETSHESKVTILCNEQWKLTELSLTSEPDIIIWDREEGTCLLIDTEFSGDRNMIKEEADKILKYKSLNNRNTAYIKYKN